MAQVRANWLKLIIGAAKRRPPAVSDAFFAELPDGLREEIRQLGMLSWVDVDRFETISNAVARGLGSELGAEFWCATMTDSLARPVLRPLREGAVGIFGRTPASLFRYGRQAWSLVTRDVCTVRFERLETTASGEPGGRQHYEGITPQLDLAEFSLFGRGAAKAVLEALGSPGDSEVLDIDATHRRITIETMWPVAAQRSPSSAEG